MVSVLRKAFRVTVVLQIPAFCAAAMMLGPARGVDFRTASLEARPAVARTSVAPRLPREAALDLAMEIPGRGTASNFLLTSLSHPSPLAEEEAFYREYVASLDQRIARDYHDRWSYHNMQMAWMMSGGNDVKHLNIGSLEFYNGANREVDVRKNFAEQVMRMRIDSTIRSYFRPHNRGTALKRTEAALNAIRHKTVALTNDDRPIGELRMGYDVFTDYAKLEYAHGGFHGGFYHGYFLAAMTGSPSLGRPIFLQMVITPGSWVPTPSLRYRLDIAAAEASLSRQLSQSLAAALSATHPFVESGIARSYNLTFTYSF